MFCYCLTFVITENVPDVESAVHTIMKEFGEKKTVGRISRRKSKMAKR